MDPTSAATGAAGWLWESYGKKVINGLGKRLKSDWERTSWDERERKYVARLLSEHSTTKLLGNPREIRLDQIYTDVYVLDQVSAFRRLDIEELREQQQDPRGLCGVVSRKPLIDIARREKRLYVLGKPGAGKSTFLKTIVRLCCEGAVRKTAIFVPLKRWSDSQKTLDDFIRNEFEICDFPNASPFIKQLLADGGAIVLFDGLDEVPNSGDKRQEAIFALTEFSRRHPNSQIVLTCRTASTEYSFENFTYVEIADFTEEQQRAFISKWYCDRPESQEKLLNEWRSHQNKDIIDLARTPLLLALFCLAYEETLTIPRRRIELYEEAVNALLRRWDSSRGIARDEIYHGLSHGRKEQMLRRIALETFRRSEIFVKKGAVVQIIENFMHELPPDDVRQGVDGEAILRAIEAQHGLLVERAYDVFSYSHLTVHEYFTAKKIVESTRTDEIIDLMRLHATDDQWREVILMVASMLDDGRFLIDTFLTVLNELAGHDMEVQSFVHSLLDLRRSHARTYGTRSHGEGGKLIGDALVIRECCVTAAANMKMLGGEEQHLALPRLIATQLQANPTFLSQYFLSNSDAQKATVAFFRLAALTTDCLGLAALRDRTGYVQSLFSSLRPAGG